MSSTDMDWSEDDAAGVEGVLLAAPDPSTRVTLDAELLELGLARGRAALLLEDRRLPGETFFARPLVPTLDLPEMAAEGLMTPEGFASAVAAWHQRLRGAPLPDALRDRLAEIAAELAEAETAARDVPDHIYTLY